MAKSNGSMAKPPGKLGLWGIVLLGAMEGWASGEDLAAITGAPVGAVLTAMNRAFALGQIDRKESGRGGKFLYAYRPDWEQRSALVTPTVESYGLYLDRATDAAWAWHLHCEKLLALHKDGIATLTAIEVKTLEDWNPQALSEYGILRRILDAAKLQDRAAVQEIITGAEFLSLERRKADALTAFNGAGFDLMKMKPKAIQRVFWAWASVNGYIELVGVHLIEAKANRRKPSSSVDTKTQPTTNALSAAITTRTERIAREAAAKLQAKHGINVALAA